MTFDNLLFHLSQGKWDLTFLCNLSALMSSMVRDMTMAEDQVRHSFSQHLI